MLTKMIKGPNTTNWTRKKKKLFKLNEFEWTRWDNEKYNTIIRSFSATGRIGIWNVGQSDNDGDEREKSAYN